MLVVVDRMHFYLLLALLTVSVVADGVDDPATNAGLVSQLRLAPTEIDRLNILNDSNFVFNFLNPAHHTVSGAGGSIVEAFSGNFPAVIGENMAMALGFMGPCSINTPHTHPRASEIQLVLNGSLESGFLVENGARFVMNTVPALSASVFPRGAIHFQANLGCEPIIFAAAFNNEDPGISQVAQRFFGLNPEAVGAALGGLGVQQIEALNALIPNNIADFIPQCFIQCGLTPPGPQPTSQQQPRVSGNAFN